MSNIIFWRRGLAAVALLFSVTVALAHGDTASITTYDDYTYINAQTGTEVRIYVEGDTRYMIANGIPDHETGTFPGEGVQPQDYNYTAPANPVLADAPTFGGLGKFGLTIVGVPLEREAAEWHNDDRNSGWQYDILGGALNLGIDINNAHIQSGGLYHYHGVPTALVESFEPTEHPHLVGFAGDGFPVYVLFGYTDAEDPSSAVIEMESSYRLKTGTRPDGPGGAYDGTYNEDWEYVEGAGDLDECNGRTGVTPQFPEGTYYYLVTNTYPRIPMCWAGTPDDGWRSPQGGQGGGPGGGQGGGPGGDNGERSGPPPGGRGGGQGQGGQGGPPPRPGSGG
ncbi:MAG: YHYH protein [Chloroflexota bacterium]